MKRFFFYIIMYIAALLPAMALPSFRTAELERLAKAVSLGVEDLPNGYSHPTTNGMRLTVHITDGTVDHIGLFLFADEVRQAGQSPVFDFLERYFLQLKYPSQQMSTANMMRDDQFRFHVGTMATVSELRLTDAFSYTNDRHRYHATWNREGQPLLEVSFPVEYELISGENKIESEDNLLADIRRTQVPPVCPSPTESPNGYYVVRTLTNRIYIVGNRLVSGINYPVEAAANILLCPETEGDYNIQMTQVSYGFRKTEFTVPLRQWIAFCRQHGCELYFGLDGTTADGGVNCVIVAVNQRDNYNHVLTVTVPADVIDHRRGTVEARLYPYVPTHNVLNLFATYRKSNPKTFVEK